MFLRAFKELKPVSLVSFIVPRMAYFNFKKLKPSHCDKEEMNPWF